LNFWKNQEFRPSYLWLFLAPLRLRVGKCCWSFTVFSAWRVPGGSPFQIGRADARWASRQASILASSASLRAPADARGQQIAADQEIAGEEQHSFLGLWPMQTFQFLDYEEIRN
jgi:hypothetical protein